MAGTRTTALATNSPAERMLRTIDDRRGTTSPRSIMCLVANAVAAAFAASSGPKPGGTAGKFRGSASPAALKKTARQDGGLHDGLKTLGVHGFPLEPMILPPRLRLSRSLGSLAESPKMPRLMHSGVPNGPVASRL